MSIQHQSEREEKGGKKAQNSGKRVGMWRFCGIQRWEGGVVAGFWDGNVWDGGESLKKEVEYLEKGQNPRRIWEFGDLWT